MSSSKEAPDSLSSGLYHARLDPPDDLIEFISGKSLAALCKFGKLAFMQILKREHIVWGGVIKTSSCVVC